MDFTASIPRKLVLTRGPGRGPPFLASVAASAIVPRRYRSRRDPPLPHRSTLVSSARLARGALAVLLLASLGAVRLPAQRGARSATPPNFVVLTADDMGYGDLASYGNPTIRTPRLDRMAAEGIRFTSFYAAAAVCTPSRAAFLTGRYAVRSGLTRALLADEPIGLRDAELTLAELLRERGYR